MAQIFDIRLKGLQRVKDELNRLARMNPRVAQLSLRTEGEIDLTEMLKRTPVDINNLRTTGRIETVPGQIGIRWAFGGKTGSGRPPKFVDYAVVVHEDLFALHTTGQAKYMESVTTESLPFYAQRIGRRWAREMALR